MITVPAKVTDCIPVPYVRDHLLARDTQTNLRGASLSSHPACPNILLVCAANRFDAYAHMTYRAVDFVRREIVDGDDEVLALRLRTLRIYLLLAPSPFADKYLPPEGNTILPDHVNSGVTVSAAVDGDSDEGDFIVVYREDEWLKVFFHEIVHALRLDVRHDSDDSTRSDAAIQLCRETLQDRDAMNDAFGPHVGPQVVDAARAATDDHLRVCINESYTEAIAAQLHRTFMLTVGVASASASAAPSVIVHPPTDPQHVRLAPPYSETPVLGYVFLKALASRQRQHQHHHQPSNIVADADKQRFQMDFVWEDTRTGIRW